MIHAFVPGTPVPQGSVDVYRGHIVAVKPALREWRNKIRASTMARHEGPAMDGPLNVSLVFQLAPPKKPRWWAPAVKPDADKLCRAVFDSLSTTKTQKGVIVDDARIIHFDVTKTYHHTPGVYITITQAGEPNA